MCMLIFKFSSCAGRLIRAQADEEHPHGPERPGDFMEMASSPCYSNNTVSFPHFLEMNKGKEIEAYGRLSKSTNETE